MDFCFAGAIFCQGCSQVFDAGHFSQFFAFHDDADIGVVCAVHHYFRFHCAYHQFHMHQTVATSLLVSFWSSLLLPAMRLILSAKHKLQIGLPPMEIVVVQL